MSPLTLNEFEQKIILPVTLSFSKKYVLFVNLLLSKSEDITN
jgi:hypothetical protein